MEPERKCELCEEVCELDRYGCEGCGKLVCGKCLTEGEPELPPFCLNCDGTPAHEQARRDALAPPPEDTR